MTNFWDFESQLSYNRRKAAAWEDQARQDSGEFLQQLGDVHSGLSPEAATPLHPDNVFGPKNLLSSSDLATIQAPVKKPDSGGHGFLHNVADAVGSVASDAIDTAFLGPINKPWDLLRPVQRALEQEQKYVARPLARAALSPFGDYESLPGIVRMGAETLFDPLTYIGPGAITKAAKVAKIGWEAKLAAPALEALFESPGSKRVAAHVLENASFGLASVAGASAAEAAGLPGIVGGVAAPLAFGRVRGKTIDEAHNRTAAPGTERGPVDILPGSTLNIINPDDQRVYHGTVREFPSFDERQSGANYKGETQFKNSIYVTKDPEIASTYADPNWLSSDKEGNRIPPVPGSNIRPLTLTAGSKLYDPAQAPWVQHRLVDEYDYAVAHDPRNPQYSDEKSIKLRDTPEYKAQEVLNGMFGWTDTNGEYHEGSQNTSGAYNGPWFDDLSQPERDTIQEGLKAAGYHGLDTPHEIIIFDKTRLKNAYGGGQALTPWKDPKFQQSMKSEDEALGPTDQRLKGGTGPAKRQGVYDMTSQKGLQAVEDQWIQQFNKKVARGEVPSESDINKATDILSRRSVPGAQQGQQFGGPGAQKASSLLDLLAKVQAAPNDLTSAKNRDELMAWADQTRSFTQQARSKIADSLTEEHIAKIRGVLSQYLHLPGIRLEDTEVTHYINENMRMRQLGPNFGAATGAVDTSLLEKANKSGVLRNAVINHAGQTSHVIRDPAILQQLQEVNALHPELKLGVDGQLHMGDFMESHRFFQLTPEQQDLVEMVQANINKHLELESAFGIEHPADPEGGYLTHRQLVKTQSPDVSGVLVEGPNGPVVAAKPGTKQAFARARTVPSISAGIAAGNHYLPFVESQQARVAQGYATMADEWLNQALDAVGKKPVDLLPKDLVDNIQTLAVQRGQMAKVKEQLSRAATAGYKNSWVSPKFNPATPEIENLINNASITSTKTGISMAERKAEWKIIQERAVQHDELLRSQLDPLNAAKKEHLQKIVSGEDLSARQGYTTGFKNRYYEPKEGQQLLDMVRNTEPRGIERTINQFNNSVRPIMATLDASFMGIQGLLGFFMNPKNYYKSAQTVFGNGYGDYVDTLSKSGRLDAMVQDGVHWASKNDFSEFIFPSAIQRLPIIGKAADISNSWFSQFGNVLRSEMYNNGLRDFGSDIAGQARKKQFVRNLNLITGFTPTDPSSMEKTFTFAPRFFRSQLGLLADAVTKRQLSDQGALRALGSLAIGGSMLTYAFNEMLGQPTDTDPTSPNFMRIRWGGQDTSIFGSWDTLMRAMTKTVTEGPQSGAEYLARVKASPAIGKIWDLAQGHTMQGDALKSGSVGDLIASAGALAKSVGPISATNLITQPPDLTDPSSLAMTGIQFLGTKSTPLSNSETMFIQRDAAAQKAYGTTWDKLEPYQQNKLKTEQGLDIPSSSDRGKQLDYQKAIGTRLQADQEKLDASLPVGKDWIDAYHNLKHEQVGAYAQWAQQNPDAAAWLKRQTPRNANDAAMQQMFNLFDQADKEGWSPSETDDALTQFRASITPEQQGYIDRNTGLRDTERVKEYKAAQKILKPYWDLQDQVWDRLKGRLPDGQTAPDMQTYTNNLVQQLQDEGVPDSVIVRRIQSNPVLREVQRATTTLRDRYRQAHRGVDAELVKWYGYQPSR